MDSDLRDRIKNLPTDLQKTIEDLDVYEKMISITDKHGLLINEGGDLYEEVKKVISGESKAENFHANIKRELDDVDKETLGKVITDIDEEIFKPIKQGLMKIEGGRQKEEKEESETIQSDLKKEDVLRDIEEPVHYSTLSRREVVPNYPTPPKTSSSSLAGITERLRNRDLNVVTDAKRLEDLRREQMARNSAPEKAEAPSSLPDRLQEIVRTPRQNIEIKPAEETPPPKSTAPDPYREQV